MEEEIRNAAEQLVSNTVNVQNDSLKDVFALYYIYFLNPWQK
ncbi:Hypothetical protein Ccan_08950 [Capnocytophaga canimorsus Cc5]|uniref:Uncharacterized protein n=1 Tax=Capnocytophaga canimorsus (strain 5) TaxID=860228 RepID=F9YUF8_CAPCC|nr:Hypothetical protein Ccan_08950 [Capnocytophaga canimorsus Cc5]